MKKKTLGVLSAALSAVMLFAACNGGGCNQNFKEVYVPDMVVSTDKYDTTHIYDAVLSDKDLVKDGKSDYTIVYPAEEQSEWVKLAVEELQTFFYQATGIMLPATTDTDAKAAGKTKVLSLGRTSYVTNQDHIAEADALNNSGFIIRTDGDAVLMFGNSGYGALYAAYEFLHMQFGYKTYAKDEIAIETNVTDKKLYDFNVTDEPDFEYRLATSGEGNHDVIFASRLHAQTENNIWIPYGGKVWHNYLDVLPYDKYGAAHPDWYNSNRTNLNIGVDMEEMTDAALEQLKKDVLAYPELNQVTFTQEDGSPWGDAPINQENLAKYGTQAVEAIRFINMLTEKFEAWLEEAGINRKVRIVDFAYSHMQQAPVTVNADGSMTLMEPDLHYTGNNAIMICTSNVNAYFSLYHEQNEAAAENIQKWKQVSDTIYFWMYNANFKDYLLPFDNFSSMQANYQYAYENGAGYIMDMMQWNQVSGTDWYRLKQWLSAQLTWNVQLDVPSLINEFFAQYFKGAAPEMRKVFDSQRAWFAHLAEQDPSSVGSINTQRLHDAKYWPEGVLRGWLEGFDAAQASIESLKSTDAALYEKLSERILQETISIRYLLITLYPETFDDVQTETISLVRDCYNLGVTRSAEFVQVGESLL